MRGGGKIVPIILAAGPSGDLRLPKALVKFGDRTALEIALDNCAGLAQPIVVLGSQSARVEPFVPAGARVVVNSHWRQGQMSSLRAALRAVPAGADFLLYPVDYPLLTRRVIEKLVAGFRARKPRQNIAVPHHQDRSGHPVIFAGELRPEFNWAQTAREIVYRDSGRVKLVVVGDDGIWRDVDSAPSYEACRREFEKRINAEDAEEQRKKKRVSPRARRDLDGLCAKGFSGYLNEVRAGLPITRDMALRLIACRDLDLPDLLAAATHLKEQFKPGIITYSRKVFLPLTNLCRDDCGYCIFRRDPGQPGAHTMSPDEVLSVTREGERLGCTEALFSLGDKPEQRFPEMSANLRRLGYKSTLQYLEAMCELVLGETSLIPHANPGLMSPDWLRRLRTFSPSLGLMLESTSAGLMRKAAHRRAPDKVPARRLAVIEAAGRNRIPFTTGILIGIGETRADRVDSLFAIARLHRRYGHIQEVIVQNFRVKPGIPMARRQEPTMGEMLRTIAVARLILRNMNLQAPPNLSAPDYEKLLSAGINDWGGISPLTPDFINPERPWPHLDELERRTRAAGFSLRQRLPVYPEFLPMAAEAGRLAMEKLGAAADPDGYARIEARERVQAAKVIA
ncbi:MAG: 7,8-didemethyl-8-hydroxy-5-deazariboflavin synthase CofG [Terriglobales bacterium]